MRNRQIILFSAILLLVFQFCLTANDGRDRYAGIHYNEMWLFPDSPELMAGYRVLAKDGPGGADGDRAFRWAGAQAVAFVRLAAYETEKILGKGNHPMPVFDLSAENGDTPVGFSADKPPVGRHPGGSHDGGLNLDLGYYQTSLEGLYFSPDHSACTNHFKAPKKKGEKPKDAYICNGPADRLDVPRQAFFMLQLFRMNRDLFKGEFLEQIGMDWEIQKAIVDQLTKWVTEGKYGARLQDLDDMKAICTADRFEGWAGSHHHHLHLRLRHISLYGKHRAGFQQLFEAERFIDHLLLTAKRDSQGPALRARLYSYRMQRTIDTEVLGRLPDGASVRFRVAGAKWLPADPAYWKRKRAVLSLPMIFHNKERTVNVEAEITVPGEDKEGLEGKGKNGDKQVLSATVILPRMEPYLFVSVDPKKLGATYERSGDQWKLKAEIPEVYRTYVTGVYFDVYRNGKGFKSHEASIMDFSFTLNDGKNNPASTAPIQLIRARVVLSSRMSVKIPIYVGAK